MHRHELDRGDAKADQVLDDGRVREAGVGTALVLGHGGVQPGEAAHMRLVDDALVVGRARRVVVAPVEIRIRHDAARHVRGRIGVVRLVGVAELITEGRLTKTDAALDRLGVRVKQ